jgi:hypothetical protein
MEFSKQELKLILEVIAQKLDAIEQLLSIQQEVIFDMTERGEDTEEAYSRVNELDELLGKYAEIYNKLERGILK